MEPKQEVATVPQENAISALLARVDLATLDVEKLDKLLAMQERWESNQRKYAAEIEFNSALPCVMQEMPVISKRGYNDHTRSKYELLEDIVGAVNPILAKHGFTMQFDTDYKDNGVEITCILLHRGGHSSRHKKFRPLDSAGAQGKANKTLIHATASAESYAKRAAIKDALNLQISSFDDDGQAAANTPMSDIQQEEIKNLLMRASDKTREWFKEKYTSVQDVPNGQYTKLREVLLTAIQKAEAVNGNS